MPRTLLEVEVLSLLLGVLGYHWSWRTTLREREVFASWLVGAAGYQGGVALLNAGGLWGLLARVLWAVPPREWPEMRAVRVFYRDLGPAVDGFTYRSGEDEITVVINSELDLEEQALTLVHELAHLHTGSEGLARWLEVVTALRVQVAALVGVRTREASC